MSEKEESFLNKVNRIYGNTIYEYSNYIAGVTQYDKNNNSKELDNKKDKKTEKEPEEQEL